MSNLQTAHHNWSHFGLIDQFFRLQFVIFALLRGGGVTAAPIDAQPSGGSEHSVRCFERGRACGRVVALRSALACG